MIYSTYPMFIAKSRKRCVEHETKDYTSPIEESESSRGSLRQLRPRKESNRNSYEDEQDMWSYVRRKASQFILTTRVVCRAWMYSASAVM